MLDVMTIESSVDLFSHIRSDYVGRWLNRIAEVKRSGDFVGAELEMRGAGGSPVLLERGGFPFLADIVARDAGTSKGVSCIFSQVVTFEPVRFNHDGLLPLVVYPFFWTAVPLRIRGADIGAVRRRVARWAERWYGLTGTQPVEAIAEEGLRGVIHRVQYLEHECTPECVAIEVDLGSAHVEALMTLLDAMKACGAREVRLGDPDLVEA